MKKEYLGASVYAAFDGYLIVLTTENGYKVTNTIFMDTAVFEALRGYVDNLTKEAKQQFESTKNTPPPGGLEGQS